MPGGVRTGKDRRQTRFIPPKAPVLKGCFNVAAPLVHPATNRRCEPFD
jgi:hypothetical protein